MSNYSSYRGRGRTALNSSGPRFSGTPFHPVSLPGDRDILEGLSADPLQKIENITPKASDTEVKISDLQYVGSYNWVDELKPTIIVPGSPMLWSNRAPPYQVHADDGMMFKDQNGFRSPKSVLLPLVTAVDKMSKLGGEDFDWAGLDFVTDRNNLRKLLRWTNGSASTDFRIDTQLAGNTVLLNRWENRYKEPMSGRTFGFNFEKASTSSAPGCEKSTGHHRIVRYDFNGLQLVVRFEVDACVPSATIAKTPKSTLLKSETSSDVDDLIGALSGVSLRTQSSQPTVSVTTVGGTESAIFPKITVISAGSIVPQSTLIEMTTRSINNATNYDWKESYPQLFLSQTPHHFLAVHQRGRFIEVNKRKLDSAELSSVAAGDIQADLKKLKRLLDLLKQLIVKHGERGRLSLVCQGGELKVFERTSQASCLPDEVLQRFDI